MKKEIINLRGKIKKMETLTQPYPGPEKSRHSDFMPFSSKFSSPPSTGINRDSEISHKETCSNQKKQ
jgi:hypothetical protein